MAMPADMPKCFPPLIQRNTELTAEVEALRAQVQAVRTVTDPARDVAVSDDLWGKGWREAMVTVRSALDGGDV